jgi:hypothetical protein
MIRFYPIIYDYHTIIVNCVKKRLTQKFYSGAFVDRSIL